VYKKIIMKIVLISLGSNDYFATQSEIDQLRNDIETSIKKMKIVC
jgi:hypothetical protein